MQGSINVVVEQSFSKLQSYSRHINLISRVIMNTDIHTNGQNIVVLPGGKVLPLPAAGQGVQFSP